jgi:glycosyltransferase involved in cell wall biosynthesis
MMKVLFITGRELGYTRNDVLLRAFRRFCNTDIVGTDQRPLSLAANSLRISLLAIPRLFRNSYDLVFVGFYGQLLMCFLGPLSRRPILFDAYVSTYDTLIEDRQVGGTRSILAWAAKRLDHAACRLAIRVMLDTPIHAEYFKEQYHLSSDKFVSCPVGCNEDIFSPRIKPLDSPDRHTSVLYYSSYLPLHGVDTVVRAAGLLRHEDVNFRLIGEGQTYSKTQQLAKELGMDNIKFLPVISLGQLPEEIANADICLGGHFGTSVKAGRVVPGKIYQMLAMAAPIIATETPANMALLRHRESAYLCPPNDPQALAEAILYLHNHGELRQHIAEQGRKLYLEQCSEAVITKILQQVIEDILT